MRFVGGPKDGEELYIEPGKDLPKPRDEVRVQSTFFDEDGTQTATEHHLYRADAFGRLVHVRRLK